MLLDLSPDLVMCPNQKTRKYAYFRISCVFWFGHFPMSGIKSESIFLIKCYIINVFFCFFCISSQKNAFPKMDFQLYFQKVIWVGGGHFFCRHFFLKKQNTPSFSQVLVVTCPKPNSVTALISPSSPFGAGTYIYRTSQHYNINTENLQRMLLLNKKYSK